MYYESFICINIMLHQAFELVTGDSLFEPKAGQNFSLEEGEPFHITLNVFIRRV